MNETWVPDWNPSVIRPSRVKVVALALLAGAFVLVLRVSPTLAITPTAVTCNGSAGTLTIAVSGASSSTLPVSVAVNGGNYVVSLGGTATCTGQTFADSGPGGFPNVTVSATANQYLVLDDSNGQLASHNGGCPAQIAPSFTGTANTVDVEGVLSPAAGGDATVGLGSGALTLSEGGCVSPDVNLAGGVQTVVVNGRAPGGNTLDLSSSAGPLRVDASTTPGTVTGFTGGNPATAGFSNEQAIVGAASGSTTFVAGSTNLTLTGLGSANALDLTAVSSSPSSRVSVNLSGAPVGAQANNTVVFGTATDTIGGISSVVGAASGNTTFLAGPSSLTLAGQGTGNTLDLSAVASSQPSPMRVNLSGGTVGPQANNTVAFGASGLDTIGGISSVIGSASGNTTFLVGSSSVPTLVGQGTGNGLDLSAVSSSPVSVNFSGGTVSGQANNTVRIGATTETVSGISSVVGAASGNTTFLAGSTSLTLTGLGTGNALDLSAVSSSPSSPMRVNLSGGTVGGQASNTVVSGTSTDTISGISFIRGSASGNTTFLAGPSSLAFAGQGSGNALDLSAVASSQSQPVRVNLSGVTVGSEANNTVVFGTGTDAVSGISSVVGAASGNTTFRAGRSSLTLAGQGSGNGLDLSNVSGFSSIRVAMSSGSCGTGAGQVTSTGGSPDITDCFSHVATIGGAVGTPTTFVPDPNLLHTPSPLVVFIGQDTNSGGSTVDLSQFKSPNSSADAVNGLMVSLAANSTGNPGSVSATVNEPAATPVTFAQFANINEVIRSAFIPTVVDSGTATGVTLVTAQAVVFTSTPPSPAMQGGTYVPMATGGGSGNPVVFSVDAASAPGSCALTGGTIRFTGAGSCVIDANQAGNSQYQAAPEAQQTIPVTQWTAGATGGTSGGTGGTGGGTGGTGGATGGTGGGGSPSVSAQQILVLLVTEITPSTRARIRALLKAGGFTLMFKALAAGTVVIAWYELPPGAHLARNRPRPVLVAKGQISFASAGTRKLKVRLSAVGKRLLGSAKHVRLTSKGTFTPFGRPAVTAIRAFALKR